MAGEGGGARRGGEEKGEALPVWAPPLTPLPLQNPPAQVQSEPERGEGRAPPHKTPRHRVKGRADPAPRLVQGPHGERGPRRGHAAHHSGPTYDAPQHTVWKGRKGKARTLGLGPKAVREEAQAEGRPHTTAHTRLPGEDGVGCTGQQGLHAGGPLSTVAQHRMGQATTEGDRASRRHAEAQAPTHGTHHTHTGTCQLGTRR